MIPFIKQLFIGAVAIFFLFIGIELLRGSYKLEDPSYFVLSFFASSLIILISLVFVVSSFLKLKSRPSDEDD